MNIRLNNRYKFKYSHGPMWLYWREVNEKQHKLDYSPCIYRGASIFARLTIEWKDIKSGARVLYDGGLDNITSGKMSDWMRDYEVEFSLSPEGDRILMAFYKGIAVQYVVSLENCN